MPPPFTVRTSSSDWRGTHCVANRAIRAGEHLLSEAPLVTTSPDAQLASGLPSSEPEWQLVHALLAMGRRAQWAGLFASGEPADSPAADSDVVSWLCDAHAAAAPDVQAVYAAVSNNAFALETPLLGVSYGAAFYETAARFNHSCAPNCLSIRCGGNFFLVAAADIPTGEELTHSYLPLHALFLSRQNRTPMLHFGPACRCQRCASEPAVPPLAHAALGFPPGHASTSDGILLTQFGLHCAAGRHAHALRTAARLLSSDLFLETVRGRPLAILQLITPLFQAFWTLRASAPAALQQQAPAPHRAPQSHGRSISGQPILGQGQSNSGGRAVPGGGMGSGGAGAAPRALPGQECLALAADLAADAYEALAALSENKTHQAVAAPVKFETHDAMAAASDSKPHQAAAHPPAAADAPHAAGCVPFLPSAPLRVLRHTAAIHRFLLSRRARALTAPPLLTALGGLRDTLGGGVGDGLAWLRDDLPFLDPQLDGPPMPAPSLALLAVGLAAATRRRADRTAPAVASAGPTAVAGRLSAIPGEPGAIPGQLGCSFGGPGSISGGPSQDNAHPAIPGCGAPATLGQELLSILFAEPCCCPSCPQVSSSGPARPAKQNSPAGGLKQNGPPGARKEQGAPKGEGLLQGGGGPVAFRRCSRCRAVRYCSVECQRRDWSLHKRSCTPYLELHTGRPLCAPPAGERLHGAPHCTAKGNAPCASLNPSAAPLDAGATVVAPPDRPQSLTKGVGDTAASKATAQHAAEGELRMHDRAGEDDEDVMTIPIRHMGNRGAGPGDGNGVAMPGLGREGLAGLGGLGGGQGERKEEKGMVALGLDSLGGEGAAKGEVDRATGRGEGEGVELEEEAEDETLERAWERMQASLATGRAQRLEVQYSVAMTRGK